MTDAAPAGRAFLKPLIGAAVALLVIFGFWYYKSPESTKIKVGMMFVPVSPLQTIAIFCLAIENSFLNVD